MAINFKSTTAIIVYSVATLGVLAIIGYNFWGWFGGSDFWKSSNSANPENVSTDTPTEAGAQEQYINPSSQNNQTRSSFPSRVDSATNPINSGSRASASVPVNKMWPVSKITEQASRHITTLWGSAPVPNEFIYNKQVQVEIHFNKKHKVSKKDLIKVYPALIEGAFPSGYVVVDINYDPLFADATAKVIY